MARRSLYKFGRANTTLYGPKTDNTVVSWKYDWVELATTREEEADGPQRANNFKVKTWIKVPEGEQYTDTIEGVPDDKLVLVDQIQATAAEIAQNEAAENSKYSETPEAQSQTNMALVS